MRSLLSMTFVLFLSAAAVSAGEVDVVGARAVQEGAGSWRFDVTLRHGDEGWDHYADKWEVLSPDGAVLGTRVLYHPHVDEQPFTRSLAGVKVPADLKQVVIRGYDKVHGSGGVEMTVDLPR